MVEFNLPSSKALESRLSHKWFNMTTEHLWASFNTAFAKCFAFEATTRHFTLNNWRTQGVYAKTRDRKRVITNQSEIPSSGRKKAYFLFWQFLTQQTTQQHNGVSQPDSHNNNSDGVCYRWSSGSNRQRL